MRDLIGTRRFGPVWLAPGYTPWNASTSLLASFITIGLLAFLAFIRPYLLNANLDIPQDQQGRILGTIGFFNEIVSILLVAPIGALSDRIGRKPIYSLGFLWLAVGVFLYPVARTFPQFLTCALFVSVGVAAVGCMLAAVLADTARDDSRGALVGITGFCQGLGALVFVLGLGRMPQRLSASGMDAVAAGQLTLGIAASLCLLTALICWVGLKSGLPEQVTKRASIKEVLQIGLLAAKANTIIWFACMLQFVSFADRIIIGEFFNARLQQSGIASGLTFADAAAAAVKPYAIANSAGLVFAVIFGLMMDKINRIKAGIFAMCIAGIGYFSGGFIGDPQSDWITLVAMLLGIGQIGAIIASQTVLGQEAPPEARGAVFGLAGIAAALGVLFTTSVGGLLYDLVDKGAPFFLVSILNLSIMVFGLYCLLSRKAT